MGRLIAFGHRQRTGKDTLAGFLSQQLKMQTRGKSVAVVGFADILKETAFRLWNCHGIQRGAYYETKPEERDTVLPHFGKTVRDMWIALGNHLRRLDNDIWINALLNTQTDYLIIKDLRFDNEFDAVKARGGLCIKVVRPGIEEFNDGADDQIHKADAEWDKIVVNGKGLKELSYHATQIIEEFKL